MDKRIETRFFEAYTAYADAIFRHCYFRVSDRELAKDIMQEAFTRTWHYLARGKNPENLRAFIYRVASNLVIDHYRKKSSYSLEDLTERTGFDPPLDTTDHIMNAIDAKRALALLPKLHERYRAVLTMRYIDDFSPKEIAAITGESENAVSVRIHRAVQKLREYMEHTPL